VTVWPSISGGTPIQTVTLQQSGGVPTNQIASVSDEKGTTNYSYDAAGNVTDDGAHSYVYDAQNRIVSVDSGAATYAYDHQNRRIKKVVGSSNTHYVWEGSQVIAEYNGATGAQLAVYFYAWRRMISKLESGTFRYFLSDRLSTRLVLDWMGNVSGRMTHLPFGENFAESGIQEKHHFTSYERDSEAGTDYAVNRQYAQSVGRFGRVDPWHGSISKPQSLNRYAYVENDPVNTADPLGLCPDGCRAVIDIGMDRVVCECDRSGDLPSGDGSTPLTKVDDVDGSETEPVTGGDWIDTLLKLLVEKIRRELTQCEIDHLRNELKNADYDTGIHYITKLAGARHIAQKFEARNGGPQDDNPVNANKHCIWACELSRRFGEETSRIWTDAHECGGTAPRNNMDYHNNFIGRWLGVQESNRGKTCEELCGAMHVQVGGTPSDLSLFAIRP
jgi:RHS repeat-associated protein